MKNSLFILIALLFFTSCRNYWFNQGLKMIGAYDTKIEIKTLVKFDEDKSVIFLPMVHLSTSQFYDDVTQKVDSLQKEGYFIYYESVKASITQDTALRKLRKIRGVPAATIGGDDAIDSLLIANNLKVKGELMMQPAYITLGVMENNSRNVDAALLEMIAYYELLNGEVILEDCDFTTDIDKMSTCEMEKRDKKKYDELILEFRNNIVVQEIINERNHKKIAVIYGKRHFIGIEKELLQKGYTIQGR